jgi:hypothetical protein
MDDDLFVTNISIEGRKKSQPLEEKQPLTIEANLQVFFRAGGNG